MAKKLKKTLRFPLEMDNGKKVYSIEELRENFSFARIYYYMSNGRLSVWLRDRHLEVIANEIENICIEDTECLEKVCKILGITPDENTFLGLEDFKKQKDFQWHIQEGAKKYIKIVEELRETLICSTQE